VISAQGGLKPAPHCGKPQTVSISRIPRRITLSVSEGRFRLNPSLADAQVIRSTQYKIVAARNEKMDSNTATAGNLLGFSN